MKYHLNPEFSRWAVPAKDGGKAARRILTGTLAGSWYPGSPEALHDLLAKVLADADEASKGRTAGGDCNIFIVPHAGYAYSAPCAAYAYRRMRGRNFQRVIVLAPSHRVWLDDQFIVPECDAFSTPLGELAVDDALRREFLSTVPGASVSDAVHRDEHSAQIQYPFLQEVLDGGATVFPVIMGKVSESAAASVGAFLHRNLTPETAIVVSSDFTHYGSDFDYTPFDSDRVRRVREVDIGAFQQIQLFDADEFREYIESNHCTICGANPIYTVLKMQPDSYETTLYHYSTSADDGSGDRRFVCYLACGIKAVIDRPQSDETNSPLSDADKKTLLSFARRAIRTKLDTGRSPAPDAYADEADDAMRAVMGGFVTLKMKSSGQLRGCIGEIEPVRPLYEVVTARACDAAFRDPRFYGLRDEEFDRIGIEISALTPPHPLDDWRKIELGRHGMTVSKNGRSAVFLPQVAPEQGWTLEETLAQLCLKAGLAADDFRAGASFTVFEAIVFSEEEFA